MKSKCLAPLYVLLLLVCAREAAAQPTCSVTYDIAQPQIFPDDILFVGRVVSLTDGRPDEHGKISNAQVDVIHGYMRGKAVVAVEMLFKGQAAKEVELTLNSSCWGVIAKGQEYVFEVTRTTRGFDARHWSKELDAFPKEDVTEFVKLIRSLIKGERQPRLSGFVRHWSEVLPHHAGQPVLNVTIIAEKEGERFVTHTGADGKYRFRELPDGEYRVYPLLPDSLRPPDGDHGEPREQYDYRARVTSQGLGGARLDFMAWDNGVISGRVEDANGKPVRFLTQWQIAEGRQSIARDAAGRPVYWFQVILLWLIDKNVRQSPPGHARQVAGLKDGEFAFVNLPPGPYLLEFVGGGADTKLTYLNYPDDLPDKKDHRAINLGPGQKVRDLVIRLLLPSDK